MRTPETKCDNQIHCQPLKMINDQLLPNMNKRTFAPPRSQSQLNYQWMSGDSWRGYSASYNKEEAACRLPSPWEIFSTFSSIFWALEGSISVHGPNQRQGQGMAELLRCALGSTPSAAVLRSRDTPIIPLPFPPHRDMGAHHFLFSQTSWEQRRQQSFCKLVSVIACGSWSINQAQAQAEAARYIVRIAFAIGSTVKNL